jgi:hypothetical protein
MLRNKTSLAWQAQFPAIGKESLAGNELKTFSCQSALQGSARVGYQVKKNK